MLASTAASRLLLSLALPNEEEEKSLMYAASIVSRLLSLVLMDKEEEKSLMLVFATFATNCLSCHLWSWMIRRRSRSRSHLPLLLQDASFSFSITSSFFSSSSFLLFHSTPLQYNIGLCTSHTTQYGSIFLILAYDIGFVSWFKEEPKYTQRKIGENFLDESNVLSCM